ncbi:hypothetical protein NLG97_g7156 [Lecanicillium saksenae]|uniref:Uncharacterized protein n=1 Tax=Lecanicillium saksenae TaxID=468837 RepID=A0ACC1QNS2_9HYPO|nr:hypothetical protein NLG97_g7156 [Lecanicillium saksenae]
MVRATITPLPTPSSAFVYQFTKVDGRLCASTAAPRHIHQYTPARPSAPTTPPPHLVPPRLDRHLLHPTRAVPLPRVRLPLLRDLVHGRQAPWRAKRLPGEEAVRVGGSLGAGTLVCGAPAVSNGGYDWLRDFLNQCQDCNIDFVPVHWYGDHSMEWDLERWVDSICDLVGNRKVWITEFKGWGNEDEQIQFLKKALPYLDNKSCVERYSYFGINNSNRDLIQGNGPDLSKLGIWYCYDVPTSSWP